MMLMANSTTLSSIAVFGSRVYEDQQAIEPFATPALVPVASLPVIGIEYSTSATIVSNVAA